MTARTEVDWKAKVYVDDQWIDPSLAAVWSLATVHDELVTTLANPHDTRITTVLNQVLGIVAAAEALIIGARDTAGLTVPDGSKTPDESLGA